MGWENLQNFQGLPPDPREIRGQEVGKAFARINQVAREAARANGITYEIETKGKNHGHLDYLGFVEEEGEIKEIFSELQKTVDEINKQLVEDGSILGPIEIQYVPVNDKVNKPGIVVYAD